MLSASGCKITNNRGNERIKSKDCAKKSNKKSEKFAMSEKMINFAAAFDANDSI